MTLLPEWAIRGWNVAAEKPAPRLHRMAILRKLAQDLHTRKSQEMAARRSTAPNTESLAQTLHIIDSIVDRVEQLGDHFSFSPQASLEEAIAQAPSGAVEIPGAEIELGRAVERPDRGWERRIAREALRAGWQIWELERRLPLTEVEAFHRRIDSDLSAGGALLLWVDIHPVGDGNSSSTTSGTASRPDSGISAADYRVRWTSALPDSPSEITLLRLAGENTSSTGGGWRLLLAPTPAPG